MTTTTALDGRIEIRGLARRFGAQHAVRPVELELGPGGVTGLLGPNGSGKSTLLRMLVGLVRPSAGTATVAGVRLAGDGTAVRRRCTYAPGEIGVYGELSGREHLRWLLRGREPRAVERARDLAEALELPVGRRVRGYSHGMKRQLLFAAAMAPDVPVRVLDEPTEGLDPSKRRRVLELLRADAAAGVTILLSSHHLLEVDEVCERLVFLSDGRVIGDESAAALRSRARRLMKLAWPADADPERLEAALRELGAEAVHRHGARFDVRLASADPRAFLRALGERGDLPPPESIQHGLPSLQDLYRELYGVEGV